MTRRSTKDPGQQPFSYQAGVGQVIKGWDQGLLGMLQGTRTALLAAVRNRASATDIDRTHARAQARSAR